MTEQYDFLIVGAGLSGCTMAERLASIGKKILIIDKRSHIGGNVFDEYDESKVLVHRYGPHLFHTNSDEVFEYLSKFTTWIPYEHKVLSYVDGKYVPVPINRDTINTICNVKLKSDGEVARYLDTVRVKEISQPKNAEEAVIAKVGWKLYKKLFEGYTKKQWGREPKELEASITQRIPVRVNQDDRYFSDKHQAMPKEGYTKMVARMLANPNIEIRLGTSYQDLKESVKYCYLIYTAPIDTFFGYKFGKLNYRSLRFVFKTYDSEYIQPVAQINYPDEKIEYTRSVEIKHATGQKCAKTTIEYEYPAKDGEEYYPLHTKEDLELYHKYKEEADKLSGVWFIGRLAEFRYYNMDQAVAASLQLASKLMSL